MLTDKALTQRDLDELYDWVDSLALSRPKKNIGRDFSDAVMMAEVIAIQFPKLVELHNYPPTNSVRSKINNWVTLNSRYRSNQDKVLSKIGLNLTAEDCNRLSNSTPMAIEALLFDFKAFAEQAKKEREEQQRRFPDPFGNEHNYQPEGKGISVANKLYTSSKVQELKEVLSLLQQKISIVQRSIERKDAHIRQLQETIRQYST